MKTFPMFIKMAGKRVIICGGGEQAAQKCRLILKTEARIVVFADSLDPELTDLVETGRIDWMRGDIQSDSFKDAALVFIATGSPVADVCLHTLATEARALVNVVDQFDLCEAITPSIVDRDPVVVAIGTEGTAPVLARQIKTKLEQQLEPRLGDLAALVGRLRSKAERLEPRQRRDLWRWVFSGPVRDLFARGSEREAAGTLKAAIELGKPPAAQPFPVALVGAGAGSCDLITLRGVQRLQEADVIFYDRLIDPKLLEYARRDAERVFVGKSPGCVAWPQEKINALLVSEAKRGKRIVRLKCGDPGIFARGAEEADALRAVGIDVEIVPGVTAASVAAAATGEFLTKRGRNDALVLTTAHKRDGSTPPEWVSHLKDGAQVAVYMGVSKAPDILSLLDAENLAEATTVKIVSKAEMPDQKTVSCGASDLVDVILKNGIENPALIFLSHDSQNRAPKIHARTSGRAMP